MNFFAYITQWWYSLAPGSVTDWIQVIISSIGAIAIFLALLPQMRTAKLEELAFRRTNIPLFEFWFENDLRTLRMRIIDNPIQSYQVVITHNGPNMIIPKLETYVPAGLMKDQIISWNIEPFDVVEGGKENSLELSVIYSDLYRHTYFQVTNLFTNGEAVRFVPQYMGKKVNIPKYVTKYMQKN